MTDNDENRPLSRDSLARIANALEQMSAPVEIESAPPFCPHCQAINPTLQIEESEGAGPILTFIIRGSCNNCGRIVWAVSNEWVLHPDLEHAAMHVKTIQEGYS